MNMVAPFSGLGELGRQAKVARQLGSPFVAAVLEAGERQLDRAPRTAALIRNWPGSASRDAVAMRFNAALHAIARQGNHPALSALYTRLQGDFDGPIGEVLEAEDCVISCAMGDAPQTNEVGRSASIAAALMVARREFGLPFELLEIGASCGLNLNLGRYAFELAGTVAGTTDSSVRIAPRWRGPAVPWAAIDIVAARGTDINPLQADDEMTRERLLSYVWADQPQRARQLEEALALAQRFRPRVDRHGAVKWLSEQLMAPQRGGLCRVVFHSMVLQYLNQRDRADIEAMITHAGRCATIKRPLVRISFEWTAQREEVQLRLSCWPSGDTRLLAICHAYGDWINWLA